MEGSGSRSGSRRPKTSGSKLFPPQIIVLSTLIAAFFRNPDCSWYSVGSIHLFAVIHPGDCLFQSRGCFIPPGGCFSTQVAVLLTQVQGGCFIHPGPRWLFYPPRTQVAVLLTKVQCGWFIHPGPRWLLYPPRWLFCPLRLMRYPLRLSSYSSTIVNLLVFVFS